MGSASLQQMADRVADLLEERLGIEGQDLGEKLRRGGRILPRNIRREAEFLASSAAAAADPRTLGGIDHPHVARAYDTCLQHLKGMSPDVVRRKARVRMLARIGFYLLVVAMLTYAVMRWRGLV